MSRFARIFAKPVGRDKYASLVTDILGAHGVASISYDANAFTLKTATHGTVYLDNGYARYCAAAPKDRDDAVESFAKALALSDQSKPETFEEAKPRLLPLVRSAAYYSIVDLMVRADGNKPPEPATKNLTGDLVLGLALDSERVIHQIGKHTADKWQISFEEALAVATQNLRERTDPSCVVEHAPGLYLVATNDGYDSSRLLLTELFKTLPIYGDPVAFAPDRDHLWIAGANDTVALAMMLKLGEETHFRTYPLSAGLFRLSQGKWGRWGFTEPSLARSHREMARRRLAIDYKQQKESLEKLNELQQVDLFVASYALYAPGDGGETFSTCVWSNGVPSLLPGTEKIVLFIDTESKDILIVSRTDLQAVMAVPPERVPGLFPGRFRADTFPSSEEIETLRKQGA